LRAYRQHRKDKATKDRRKILDETTLNRDLALLRRMMVLTVREKKIQFTMPYFPMISEAHNARQGFVDPAKFWELLDAIAEKLRPQASRKIVWGWVNLDESVIYIPSNVTKTKDPLPVPLSEKLVAMLRKKFRTDGPVFDTTNFRRAFRSAADAVGLSEVIPYDLRRSAVRNMTRAGVDRSVAKKISGHKTDSVFERYNITSVEDVKKAMKQTSKYNASSIQVAVAGKKWIVVNASVLMV
jgi:integrase